MVSATFQISSLRSPFCRNTPLTLSVTAPRLKSPTLAAGCSGPIGADSSKALPMHQGRPCFFMSFCRSRRVMSRPTA